MVIGERKLLFVDKIKEIPGVEKVILFGSRSRGDAGFRSDIDLAVLYPTAGAGQWQEVLDIVEDADTLLKVDCVRLDTLPAGTLRTKIEQEGTVL